MANDIAAIQWASLSFEHASQAREDETLAALCGIRVCRLRAGDHSTPRDANDSSGGPGLCAASDFVVVSRAYLESAIGPSVSARVEAIDAFEQVLTAQHDLVNEDVKRTGEGFRQIVMLAPQTASGLAFSSWFTQPVMRAAKAAAFGADPNWSTFAHELGHNATVNSPAAFRLGDKIDGRANAIVSEALAQIFQHVISPSGHNWRRDGYRPRRSVQPAVSTRNSLTERATQ